MNTLENFEKYNYLNGKDIVDLVMAMQLKGIYGGWTFEKMTCPRQMFKKLNMTIGLTKSILNLKIEGLENKNGESKQAPQA